MRINFRPWIIPTGLDCTVYFAFKFISQIEDTCSFTILAT